MKLIKNIQSIAKEVLRNEASAIQNLIERIDDEFEKCVHVILKSGGRVVVSGIGKSAIVGQKIVATLNSAALLLLGIQNAILIGVIGAILNLLPYIGGLIAIALPVLMATVTKDGYSSQLYIIAAYGIIQFLDNNIFVPRIVSSKVQINALISIIVVLLGAALWGVPGMFLSIPFIAVLKIVFDRIDGLKPWGKLLGDNVPTEHMGQLKRFNRKPSGIAT